MPTKAPVIAAPYNWTGFYAGVSGGYGWGSGSNSLTGADARDLYRLYIGVPPTPVFPSAIDNASKGVLGGITAGYNYQMGRSLLGVEADFSEANIRGSGSFVSPDYGRVEPIVTTQQDKKLEWLSTLRGRVGYLPTPDLLVFATGGLAFGKGTVSTVSTVAPAPTSAPANCIAGDPFSHYFCNAGSDEKTMTGWTLGAGLEAMIARNWSLKAEYLYYDLGSITYTSSLTAIFVGSPALQTSVRFNGSIARIGLNYHF
ncbi:MAG TPA: outer membrane beta-barrel protein [Pseudolabrys sp.]|jgi:outer membrane immunogenic protein